MQNLSVLEKRLLLFLIILIPVVGLALWISFRVDSFNAQQRSVSLTPTGANPSGSGAGSLNQAQNPVVNATDARPSAATLTPFVTPSDSPVPTRDLAGDMGSIFKGQQKPVWKLLHGQPAFSDGFIAPSSVQGLTLQVGSQALQSYSASFDLKHPAEHWGLVLTAGKDVMGAITPTGTTWYSNRGGGWKVVSSGPGITSLAETVSFSVDASAVSVRVNGLPLTSMNPGGPVSGPLVINLSENVSLGNLAISSR